MWPFKKKPPKEDSENGHSSVICIKGGLHKKLWKRGDTCNGQWTCAKCGFELGPIGIFNFGCVKPGRLDFPGINLTSSSEDNTTS